MRPRSALVLMVVATAFTTSACTTASSTPPTAHGAGASCVGPHLGAEPFRALPSPGRVRVHPGETLRVYGKYFTLDCFDSGPSVGSVERPMAEVRLRLVTSDGRSADLATVHPGGRLSRFVVAVRVPDDAVAGPARIDDGHDAGAVLRLTVRPG